MTDKKTRRPGRSGTRQDGGETRRDRGGACDRGGMSGGWLGVGTARPGQAGRNVPQMVMVATS